MAATVDARLLALDARTRTPCAGFGRDGVVDLRRGLRDAPFETAEYEVTPPPAIVAGRIVVGSAVVDNNRPAAASGEVRACDARTGTLRWTWDPVPQQPSDPAYDTWQGPTAHRTGAANAWSVLAVDSARGLVFVPTSAPSPDYFGGTRLGRNDYANSIVALRAATGAVVWHFQTVHHDLWDYDNAAPPARVEVRLGVRRVPAVLQATKSGMLFVLHRETGVPIIPVEERRVPTSDVPGEVAWPTQPFSALPSLSPQRLDRTRLFALESTDAQACRTLIASLRDEGLFTPPSVQGTLQLPSNIGGAHWGGVAWHPDRQLAIVPVNTVAAFIRLVPAGGVDERAFRAERSRLGHEANRIRGTDWLQERGLVRAPSGLPCAPAPHGELVAVDIAARRVAWRVPLGAWRPDTSAARGAPPERARLGAVNLGGAIVTAGDVVFIAASPDRRLRALDIATGAELWSAPLPAGGKATPMTYVGADGRQYVVVAAGGDGGVCGTGDAVVAFAVPDRRLAGRSRQTDSADAVPRLR